MVNSSVSKPITTVATVAATAPVARIYLVEDSPEVREQIAEGLSSICGIRIDAYAESESEALESLMQTDYDIIIFDIHLSQGNSVSLLRSLASAQKQINALKIVFSNHAGDAWRRLCEYYGVRYFFDKSFEFQQMQAMLLRIVQERAAR